MELLGTVDKQEYTIKIDKKGEHGYVIDIDGRTYEVDVAETLPHVYSLLHGDNSFEARVHRDTNQWSRVQHSISTHAATVPWPTCGSTR